MHMVNTLIFATVCRPLLGADTLRQRDTAVRQIDGPKPGRCCFCSPQATFMKCYVHQYSLLLRSSFFQRPIRP